MLKYVHEKYQQGTGIQTVIDTGWLHMRYDGQELLMLIRADSSDIHETERRGESIE